MSDASSTNNVVSGFAYFLSENNLLDKQTALSALQQAAVHKTSYIEYLVKQRMVDDTRVAKAAAEYFGLPFCDIQAFNQDLIPAEYLGIQLVKRQAALPLFKKSGLLYLAIVDPTTENLYELRFLTGLDLRLVIVEATKLSQIIDELLNTKILSEMDELGNERLDNIKVDAYREDDEANDFAAYDVESAPVINYVNRILLDAIDKGASDIHFEHYQESYRIRFRQHGILYPITSPPLKLANYLLARLKVMSNLDITEHRVPQDGRFKLSLSRKKSVDFRVSVCPTLFGEKVVLRILDPKQITQGLDKLGMNDTQKQHYLAGLHHSQGMILVTGPTGSGKTMSLYSGLNYLNSNDRNISTVEDPVEIPLQGINQVHVNLKVGLTFSVALRSFLRQDPDVIMVGEIRDLETAEIAIKASQTGHLVLSTLHTNSAPETVTRLMNMGIAPYNLASSLTLVIAQRLLRVLCKECKEVEDFPSEVLLQEGFAAAEIGSFQLYKASGCEQCIQGYTGRIGIFEVMPNTPKMAELIMAGANALQIVAQAKNDGVMNLRESGLIKVKQGITSLAELNRVFK